MNDVITVADPGYSWTPWWWVASVVVCIFIVSGIFYILSLFSSTHRMAAALREVGSVIGVIAIIGIPAGALISAFTGWGIYSSEIDHRKEAAMSAAGYHSVDYDKRGEFVGRKDGKYVRGVVVETGDLTWQVLLVDIPESEG